MTISPSPASRPRRAGPVILAATLALLLALPAGPLRAQDKDPLVAKVNGTEIHQSDLAVAEEEAGQIPPMSPDAKQDYLVQFMADMILVSKAAEAKKMGDSADFKRRLAFARNKLLMETLLQSVGKEALTDEAMHKVYDDAVKQMGEEQEVHARHILIRAAAGDEKASKAGRGQDQGDHRAAEEGRGFRQGRAARSPRTPPARPMAAISAISPRSRWCRNSPTPPSSWTRGRFPSR